MCRNCDMFLLGGPIDSEEIAKRLEPGAKMLRKQDQDPPPFDEEYTCRHCRAIWNRVLDPEKWWIKYG